MVKTDPKVNSLVKRVKIEVEKDFTQFGQFSPLSFSILPTFRLILR